MAKLKKHDISPEFLGRLHDSMKTSRWMLERFRQNLINFARQGAGRNWSENGPDKAVPINMIDRAVSVLGRSCISKNPQVLLSTFQKENKPAVSAMQAWCNQEIQDMHLDLILGRSVTNAIYSIGITKVALATPAESNVAGWNLPAGQPFAEDIDLDDFVFDSHARRFSQAGFMGHRVRVTLASIRDSKLYSKGRKDLTASDDDYYNQEGDERINTLGRGYKGNQEEIEDMVDLWEVYLPRWRMIITLEADAGGGGLPTKGKEPLRVQEWVGPDEGPYHILGFKYLPGNAMPLSPIMNLYDLHIFINQTMRKLMDQTMRQKSVLPVRAAQDGDINRLTSADDGFAFRCDGDPPKEVRYGGPDQVNLAMLLQGMKLFNEQGGNLALLSGAGPQSPTATQDKLLNENAGGGVADMQEATVKHAGQVIRALCWYWWHDPFRTMVSEMPIPGMEGMGIVRKVTPQQRQLIPWEKLRVKVDPYSLQQQTPQSKAAEIDQVVTQIIVPLMPLMEKQGIYFDLNAFLGKRAELRNMPEISEFVSVGEPPAQTATGGGGQAPGPAETTRNYVRESVSKKTPQGQDANLINTLMGGSSGESEKNGQMAGMTQ